MQDFEVLNFTHAVIHLQFWAYIWVLGLAVSHINESNSKLMSPEHYFS